MHARVQIERCKLGIREALRACCEAGGDRPIPARHFDTEDGEIDEAHIFCAACRGPESFEVRRCWAPCSQSCAAM